MFKSMVKTEPVEEVKEFKEEDLDVEVRGARNDLFRKKYDEAIDVEGQIVQKEMQNRILTQEGFVNKGLEVSTNARLSQFEQEKIYPNMWTESTLNLLESWRKKARDASKAHVRAARSARHKHRMLSIPTLFVGATASAMAFFSAGDTCDPNDDGSDTLKYLTAVMTSGLAVLGGIASLYSFSEKMSQNITAAGAYANLATRIEVAIFLPNALRAHSEVVLTDMSSSYEHLVETSPLL